MGREFELKYRLNAGAKRKIREIYAPFREITMRTVYYDTPGGDLGKRRWTLRLRLENNVPVCTVKIPLPDGSKGEWETECDDLMRGVSLLCEMGAPAELEALTQNGVVPTCGAAFTRLAADIAFGGSRLELALDEGILFREDAQMPLLELEVELKSGSDADAVGFARELAQTYGLEPEPVSKFKRARDLK